MKPKSIYAELAEDARTRRLADARKKYSAAPPAMAEQMASEDEAVEDAKLPDVGALKVDSMADINDDDFKKAMAQYEEDEEDAKWTAKQRG